MVEAVYDDEAVDDGAISLETLIPEVERHNPVAYARAIRHILDLSLRQLMNSMDAKRFVDIIKGECRACTGLDYEDAAQLGQDPILNMTPVMERCLEEVDDLEKAFEGLDKTRIEMGLKKKWIRTLRRLKTIQKQARDDAAKFWLYVGTDDDPHRAGERIHYGRIHVEMFDIWNDDQYPHSLIEAPVGHGKSTNMRGQIAWEIGSRPELRHVYLTESVDLAKDAVRAIRKVVISPRFQAIFPDVFLLDRNQKAEDSARKFSVGRLNTLAKDATLVGAGYLSSIQGSRYDRIWGDDVCPADVRIHETTRGIVNDRWHGLVMTRLADPLHSRIRVIGTPWHEKDVLGQIQAGINDGSLRGWRVEIDQFRIHIDKQTDLPIPVWPEKWTAEALQDIRAKSPTWAFNYELRFDHITSRIITKVRFYNSRSGSDKGNEQALLDELAQSERWLSIDPAGTGNAWSSAQGVVEFVITPNNYVFIPNCWFKRCDITELLDWLLTVVVDVNAPGNTRYTGIHWEVQGAVKVGMAGTLEYFRQRLAERGVLNLKCVQTGTRVGGNKQNQGKRARLDNAAPYIQSGIVRFAGERIEQTNPDGSMKVYYKAKKGTDVERLTDMLVTWDGDKKNSDCIDATSQWILHNKHRFANPNLPRAADPQFRTFTAKQIAHKRSIDSILGMIDEDPLDVEDRFLDSMYKRGVA